MTNEKYVNYKDAKLLKDKGFDDECIGYYVNDEPEEVKLSLLGESNSMWEKRCCSAPTQQMAMDWLHDNHHLHINIVPYVCEDGLGYCYEIRLLSHTMIKVMNKKAGFDYPEEAREDAINYCLTNLI